MPEAKIAWQKTRHGKGEPVQHLVIDGDLLSLCGVMSLEYSVGGAAPVAETGVARCEECCWIALEAARMVAQPAVGGDGRG